MRARALGGLAATVLLGGAAFLLPQTGTPGTSAPAANACGVLPGILPDTPVRLPIAGTYAVTSEYGMRVNPTDGVYQLHGGIDLSSASPAPIVAAAPGTVTFAGPAGTAGNMVVIDHGESVSSRSMHMSRLTVRQGEVVAGGQQIGVQGSTGDSTGPHLHFEVKVAGRTVDPRGWLAGAGVTLPVLGDSGDGPQALAAGAGRPRTARVPRCGQDAAPLDASKVPSEFLPWVIKAGTVCEAVPSSLVAAQVEAESGWNPRAVSQAGAQGASQFMPGTWPAYGRDDDGNGQASPFDIGDAVMAQARYNCSIAAALRGLVPGDPTDLLLAGYNAGPGAVLLYGGVPPYRETRDYVARIRSLAATTYAAVDDARPAGPSGGRAPDPAPARVREAP